MTAGVDIRHWHAGAVAAPTAINIAPAAIAVGATGVDADPSLISIGCTPTPPCHMQSLRCAACMLAVFAVGGRQRNMHEETCCDMVLLACHAFSHCAARARRPKLIFVGPTGGPGMPSHLAFTPVLVNVSPTWEIMPPGADVPPIRQDGGVGIDPTPGRTVVTPPVDPGAGARDRAAIAEVAADRATGAP